MIVTGFDSLLRFESQTGQRIGNPVPLPGVAATGIVIDGRGRVYVGTSSWPNVPGSLNGIAAVEGDRVVWFFPTNVPPSEFSLAMGPDGTIYFVAGNTVFALGP